MAFTQDCTINSLKANKGFIGMIKVLFETHHLYYLPNFLPIVDEFKDRGKYDIYFSMTQQINKREKDLFSQACKDLGLNTIDADEEELRIKRILNANFDVILVANVGQITRIASNNALTVMVYHGIGLKQSYYNDIDDRIDVRSVESESRYEKLLIQSNSADLALTGFTKIDPLYTLNKKVNLDLKNSIGIKNDLPTVLYAPTFYPTSFENIYKELEFISSEYNIIFKLHNFSWFQKRYVHQSKIAKHLSTKNDNIYLLDSSDYNIIPYFLIADVLISDISSTIFEYLPLNRPIIQVECLKLRLRHRIFNKRFKKKLDLERLEGLDFVYKVDSPSELYRSIAFATDHPEEMSDLRQAAHDYYLYKNDGKSSHRLVNEIEKKLS